MNDIDLANDPTYKFCKELFESMTSETLRVTASDRAKVLEYIKNNLKPEKMNDTEYIEALVDEMQKVAQAILLRRSTNK